MSPVLEAVAEPTRRRILEVLLDGEAAVGELVDAIGISQPGMSKHLRVLREAGLVEARAEGKRRLYALNPDPLLEVDVWLAPYRRLWADRLDALARHLDERSPS